jgi:tRNA threonylcarbamoyl adenosine modification protein (Sua5/YciO/YrdC/YwlC family)
MATFLKIYPENPQEHLIDQAVDCLKKGGIIIYPSDTVYAMGCDINNIRAMERLAKIKGVKLEKTYFSIICNNLSHLSEYTKPIDTAYFRILKQCLPGPFTFVLGASKQLPLAYKGHKSVGIRVPDHSIPQLLVAKLGNPIATTSIKDDDEVLEYSTDPELIWEKYDQTVDLIIDAGYGDYVASTVVDLTGDQPEIIRQGKGELSF